MTATIARVERNVPDFAQQAVSLAAQVRVVLAQAATAADAMDVHARIQAAKAWAKAHRQLRDLRLDLLNAEVACLVRVYELGGADMLSPVEQLAARWFASMSPGERQATIRECKSVSTAAGLYRWHKRDGLASEAREEQRDHGRADASEPSVPPEESPAARASKSVRDVLGNLLNERTETGVPFSVEDVADDLLAATYAGDMDEDYIEGAREIVRHAIRDTEPERIDGTLIPKLITIRTEAGYIRIPTTSATIAHLDEWLAYRQEQAAQLVAAVDRSRKFVERVRSLNSDPTARVGDVIAASIHPRKSA